MMLLRGLGGWCACGGAARRLEHRLGPFSTPGEGATRPARAEAGPSAAAAAGTQRLCIRPRGAQVSIWYRPGQQPGDGASKPKKGGKGGKKEKKRGKRKKEDVRILS